jgi:uncharacterized membrane protein YuzA (DUF378 family)
LCFHVTWKNIAHGFFSKGSALMKATFMLVGIVGNPQLIPILTFNQTHYERKDLIG